MQATLRWAEARLARRVEDREPNLLSHTAHSVARKGVRRRDLSDSELREVLRPLAPLLRLEHVLPARAETLQSALRRGLLSTPPSRMLGGEHHTDADAWLRGSPIWVIIISFHTSFIHSSLPLISLNLNIINIEIN